MEKIFVCFAEGAEEDFKLWHKANKVTFNSMEVAKGGRPQPWYIPGYESFSRHNVSIMQRVKKGILANPVDGI